MLILQTRGDIFLLKNGNNSVKILYIQYSMTINHFFRANLGYVATLTIGLALAFTFSCSSGQIQKK